MVIFLLLFARGMGFSFTSTSSPFTFVFRCYCLISSFLYFRLGRQGSTRAIVMRFFMGKCTKASRGSRSMRIFSEVDAQYAD